MVGVPAEVTLEMVAPEVAHWVVAVALGVAMGVGVKVVA